MIINRRRFIGAMVAGSAGMIAPRVFAAPVCGETPALLPQALAALDQHSARVASRDLIGIVNFAAHSRLPRFQLVDVAGGRVIASMLVAHGSGSDPGRTGWTERFSNRHGSNASSRGAFLTGDTYSGKHGRSRRLIGLDTENNAALGRGIVIHAASYVGPDVAAAQGRIGRSQGCFAVSDADIRPLLARLGPGHLLFAWKEQA